MQKELPSRQSIRLKEYNYSSDGAYFVTMHSFNSQINFLRYINIIESQLKEIKIEFPGVELDEFSIMRNHIHLILIFEKSRFPLSRVLQSFKSKTWKDAHEKAGLDGKMWQRNYFEHIIRDEKAYERFRLYILRNPEKHLLIDAGFPIW